MTIVPAIGAAPRSAVAAVAVWSLGLNAGKCDKHFPQQRIPVFRNNMQQ
jgi:hypothetical protein